MTDRRRLAGLHAVAWAALSLASLAGTGCGGNSSPVGPSNNNPVIATISPTSGSTFGGTEVVITGERFIAGSRVLFGGVEAASVAVEGTNRMRATTPAHAAGAVDVMVSASTGSSTLAQAFTFVAPGANAAPTIRSLTAKGRRTNEPSNFADLAETIDVQAAVEDAETSVDRLALSWSADIGTIQGTGAVVTWTAPASARTPVDATITLTVVEAYKGPDSTGLPVDRENRVVGTVKVSLHDSASEVGNMAYNFLVKFSDRRLGADEVLRDFTPSCSGTASERQDIVNNRATRVIQSSTIGRPAVTVSFGGTCPFRSRAGDACAQVPASWKSLVTDPTSSYFNWIENTTGTDQVVGVFTGGRWWLCDSDWNAPPPTYTK